MTSKEINKDTIPVLGEYDLIVVGAGHAGCEAEIGRASCMERV